jgi:hypothetical protein
MPSVCGGSRKPVDLSEKIATGIYDSITLLCLKNRARIDPLTGQE